MESIEKEIVRLVKEIAEDELELKSAVMYKRSNAIEALTGTIERKMRLIEILKKQ